MHFGKKTDLFRFNLDNDSRVKKVNAEQEKKLKNDDAPEKLGETTITKEIDVKSLMPSKTEQAPKTQASAPQTNEDNIPWNSNTNLMNFINETLVASGIEPTNELVNAIFKKIIKEILNGNFEDIANIKLVTQLIDINLEEESNENIFDVTQLIDVLLNIDPNNEDRTVTTVSDVKNFILQTAEEVNSQTPPTPPVSDVTDEPVVINTPEDAINVITEKIITADFDENTTINDFLKTLQAETSKYIQLKFGYNAGFSDVVALFIAKAVSDTCGVESGLMKDADLESIKNKFLAQLQDNSFLDTSTNVMTCVNNKNIAAIHYIRAAYNSNGYYTRGTDWYGNDNSLMTYNPDGMANNGNFLNFLTEYMKNEIYGGTLNESQLQYVMQKVIGEFGNGYLQDGGITINMWAHKTELDKNGNNTFFDEFYDAILKAAEEFKPINVENATTINLDELFGDKTVFTAADIHNNEVNYLTSNDPGIRAVFAALVNASDKYNITTDVDYLDFLNVFIRMFNEMCGVPNTNPPTLSRATLENYLQQPGAVQELRNFVMSAELRNAYYMESFVINEELEVGYQGESGDCWLHAGLISLKQTEAGRQIIADAIDSYVGEDGQTYYTVTFNGGFINGWPKQITTTYTFSVADIFEATGSGNYALGSDWDLRLIEIAVSKLKEEQFYSRWPYTGEDGDPNIHGGGPSELVFYLTGYGAVSNMTMPDGVDMTEKYPYRTLDRLYNEETGKYEWLWYDVHTREELRDKMVEAIANGTMQSGGIEDNTAYTMIIGGHAYGIVGFTEDGILYVDPYAGDKTLFMSWNEYINSYAEITYIPLIVDEN